MNNFSTQDLLVLAKQKNQKELLASQLIKNSGQVSSSKRLLRTLGTWMVASGEKLQALNADPTQLNQLGFSQNKASKAKV